MFVPIFGYYSVTMWKDVLFGAFVLLLMIQIYKISLNDFAQLNDYIIMFLCTIGVGLFRSNGMIISVILTMILIIFLKQKRAIIFKTMIIPLILCVIIKGPLLTTLNIKGGNFVENLGIPLRQISGVIAKGYEIDSEDYNFVNKLVPIDIINEKYTPDSVDEIKFSNLFDNSFLEDNKSEFFRVWFNIFKKYPIEYTQIYLRSTYGFWYPESQGYGVHKWAIENNDYGLYSNSKFNVLKINEIHNGFYNSPLLKYFISDAFCFWGLLYAIGMVIYKKKYNYIYPLLLPLFVWVTIVIATPVAYQPRYTFSLFCTFPFVIFILLKVFENEEKFTKH